MTVNPGPPPADMNKAYGASGAVLLGGAIARVAARLVNAKWPGLIDDVTLGDLSTLVEVPLAFAGAYYIKHSS